MKNFRIVEHTYITKNNDNSDIVYTDKFYTIEICQRCLFFNLWHKRRGSFCTYEEALKEAKSCDYRITHTRKVVG